MSAAAAPDGGGRWRGLFGTGPYAFAFGVRRGAAADWLRPGGPVEQLAERRRWLDEQPERHRPWQPAAAPLLAELAGLLAFPARGPDPAEQARALGGAWAPDFLLLSPDAGGDMVFRGGCVCFPTSWAPEDKLGLPVTAIHAPVPTLNTSLGRRIRDYLARAPAGAPGERENWGLAATPELNLHPALDRPRLTAAATPGTTWLRVERQAFVPLPASGGLAFLIRLEIERLDRLAAADPAAARALAAALETMPDEVAAYKGLTMARSGLAAALRAAA